MSVLLRLVTISVLACAALAMVQPPAPEPPRRVDCLRPVGMTLFAPGPVGKAVVVPARFACESVALLACESPGEAWAAVGSLGERGGFQIMPFHRERMAALGLDYGQESDRIRFAVVLYAERGWDAWSCGRNKP